MDDHIARIEKVLSEKCPYSYIYRLWTIAVVNDYVFLYRLIH